MALVEHNRYPPVGDLMAACQQYDLFEHLAELDACGTLATQRWWYD